jgi:hypothetical protein
MHQWFAVLLALFMWLTGAAPVGAGTPELIYDSNVPSLHARVIAQYGDCTGVAPLTYGGAYLDICITDVRYVVGHDVNSILRPLHQAQVGDTVTDYWPCPDTCGRFTTYRVIAIQRFFDSSTGLPPVPVGTSMQLQTCEDTYPDGSHLWQARFDEIVSLSFVANN